MNFRNNAYMTNGFDEQIPAEQKLLIFAAIEQLKSSDNCDYLQVFKFSPEELDGITVQRMNHSQEEPLRSKDYTLITDEIITATVFVIDDETHHTFLLADEY